MWDTGFRTEGQDLTKKLQDKSEGNQDGSQDNKGE